MVGWSRSQPIRNGDFKLIQTINLVLQYVIILLEFQCLVPTTKPNKKLIIDNRIGKKV